MYVADLTAEDVEAINAFYNDDDYNGELMIEHPQANVQEVIDETVPFSFALTFNKQTQRAQIELHPDGAPLSIVKKMTVAERAEYTEKIKAVRLDNSTKIRLVK